MLKQKPMFPWKDDSGHSLECTEKVKVLNENHQEFESLLKDVYEEGLALGVSKESIKESLLAVIKELG